MQSATEESRERSTINLNKIMARNESLPLRFLILSLALVPLVVIWALSSGAIQIDLSTMITAMTKESTSNVATALQQQVLVDIRMPRVLMTVSSGCGLAICGLVLQSLFRNPLAEPGLLGVSSSAALFAALGFYLLSVSHIPPNIELIFIPSMAMIGASLAMMLLLLITSGKNPFNTLILILAGVAISAGSATLLGLITFLVDDSTLRLITFWTMGSYSGISWQVAIVSTAIALCSSAYFYCKRNALMIIALGEKQARYQGIDTQKIKMVSLLLVGLVVAICVSFTGIVGFVGLVVPHICRFLVGHHLRLLLPMCAVVGALLVTVADTMARLLIVPAELPIGLLTSAIGVPFFIYLILKARA